MPKETQNYVNIKELNIIVENVTERLFVVIITEEPTVKIVKVKEVI
jgi:hypothetical protein